MVSDTTNKQLIVNTSTQTRTYGKYWKKSLLSGKRLETTSVLSNRLITLRRLKGYTNKIRIETEGGLRTRSGCGITFLVND